MQKNIIILTVLLVTMSCHQTPVPENVKKVLEIAGENRSELEKVLRHYSRKKSDSLKYEAACYLIANMPGHYAYYYKHEARYDTVFNMIGKVHKDSVNKRSLWDSAATYFEKIDLDDVSIRHDVDIITSEFLMAHIDQSFYALENFPWCKGMSFARFKKYVLPYRSSNEPLERSRGRFQEKYNWVIDSLEDKNSMAEAFEVIYNEFDSWFETTGSVKYPVPLNYNQVLSAKGGACNDQCNLLNMIMRAMGITSVMDNIPHWANRNNAHAWVAFLNEDNEALIVDNDKTLRKHEHLHSAVFEIKEPADKFIPDDIELSRFKKAPKVFRIHYAPNPNSIASNNKSKPHEIEDRFLTDVSTSYLKCHDVTFEFHEDYNKRFVYLCIFDKGSLYAVHGSEIRDNNVVFESMSIDVQYFLTIYHQQQHYVLTDPFILEKEGDIRYLRADSNNKQQITVKRKYPLFPNILNYANDTYKGKIQGSNKADFSDAKDLYVINYTPLKYDEVPVSQSGKYRYFRYLAPENRYCNIAELKFFTRKNGTHVLLKGNYIYNEKGSSGRTFMKAFDDDLNAYYGAGKGNQWVGIDLGKGEKKQLSKVGFCPRTDTNFIIPGNEYELFYWDNGWQSLGKTVADSFELRYDHVPQGALLWLHCHSGGQEERPFTYEDGKQVWW